MSREGFVGEFTYWVGEDRWWWSDAMYQIFGFTRGEVVPTTDLLRFHKHPDDASWVAETFRRVLATGGPYSCYCRIVDAAGRTRYVVVVGDAELSAEGTVSQLSGYLVEMTEARRRDAAAEADAAVRAAVDHRACIEQAKGALMFVHGVDADTAFALLRGVSQQHNIKLHQVARQMMANASGNPPFPAASRRLATVLRQAPTSLKVDLPGTAAGAPDQHDQLA